MENSAASASIPTKAALRAMVVGCKLRHLPCYTPGMIRPKALLASASLLAVVTLAFGASAGPKKPKKPAPAPVVTEEAGAAFDRQAASAALSSVDLLKCKSTNAPRGEGHVSVKFTPTEARPMPWSTRDR